jgi:hypothetical protein
MALYFGRGKIYEGEEFVADVDYTLDMTRTEDGVKGRGELTPVDIDEMPVEFKDAFLKVRSGNMYPISVDVWDSGNTKTWEFDIRSI